MKKFQRQLYKGLLESESTIDENGNIKSVEKGYDPYGDMVGYINKSINRILINDIVTNQDNTF